MIIYGEGLRIDFGYGDGDGYGYGLGLGLGLGLGFWSYVVVAAMLTKPPYYVLLRKIICDRAKHEDSRKK